MGHKDVSSHQLATFMQTIPPFETKCSILGNNMQSSGSKVVEEWKCGGFLEMSVGRIPVKFEKPISTDEISFTLHPPIPVSSIEFGGNTYITLMLGKKWYYAKKASSVINKLKKGYRTGNLPTPKLMVKILKRAQNLFEAEPNIVSVDGPTTIAGDFQGHFDDLLAILNIPTKDEHYVFCGDYDNLVCYGEKNSNGPRIILLLLLYKIWYPNQITVLRGNKECEHLLKESRGMRNIESLYGKSVVEQFLEVCLSMPVAAVVEKKYFVTNGGPFNEPISEMQKENKKKSDKLQIALESHESCSSMFGGFKIEDTRGFLQREDLKMIINSYMLPSNPLGYCLQQEALLLTICSARGKKSEFSIEPFVGEMGPAGGYVRVNQNQVELFSITS